MGDRPTDLERVRDLLFGEQSRRLSDDISALSAVLEDRMQQIDAAAKNALERATEAANLEFRHEREQRIAVDNSLSEAIKNLSTSMDESFGRIESRLLVLTNELRETIASDRRRMARRVDELESRLTQEKVSRHQLAELFQGMAHMLADHDAGQDAAEPSSSRTSGIAPRSRVEGEGEREAI